jgi:predicted nuclease with TOPRIM domain
MRIAQATTLHWGGLPNMDYDFGAHTLLAGETGSGKTSLIDAIIAVMAGGDARKSKFNTAQSQAGQSAKKTRRTLASYVTGSNGMGGYLRAAGAHGYVCVAWTQDENDGPYGTPFTAILGAEATLDRDVERAATLNGDVIRILVRGHRVGHADLISPAGTVLPGAELIVALHTKFGTAAVRDFKSGGEYLAMLYAYLKGDTTPVSREEADSAIKAFVSAIAYRQPDDIDGLIREEILDAVDNESLIQRLMETIREVNRLKIEAARMEGNIAQLEGAERNLRDAFEAFMEERMFRALIEVRRAHDIRELASAKLLARNQNQADLDATESAIAGKKVDQDKRQKHLADLRGRITKEDAYGTKLELEGVIAEQDREMAAILARVDSAEAAFKSASRDVATMHALVRNLPELAEGASLLDPLRAQYATVSLPGLRAAIKAVQDGLGAQSVAVLREHCTALQTALTEVWDHAVNGEAGLRSTFNRAFRNADSAYEEKTRQRNNLLRRIDKLKIGEIEYPPAVDGFLQVLRAELPQCKPRVLCDVVEVSKPEWQSAIEGYLGRDRFTVLYDRDYETEVVKLARAFRRERAGPPGDISVPQLTLAISDRPHVDDASIVHVIAVRSDHEAEGYLKARYGRTLRVSDTVILKNTRSGLMQDGWSTQGYRYQRRHCLDEDLVFGAEIRRRQREVLRQRADNLQKEIEALQLRRASLGKAAAIAAPPAVTLTAEDASRFDEAAALRRMAADELDGLDLSTIEGLTKQAQALEGELTKIAGEIEELSITKGGLQKVIQALDIEINALKTQLAELDPKAEAATAQYSGLMARAFIDSAAWPKRFDEENAELRTVETYDRRSRERTTLIANASNELNLKLEAYKRNALDFQQVQVPVFAYDPHFPAETVIAWMDDAWRQIREQIRSQRDTGLPERRLQCEMAERSFTSSFTTDFCATVLSNVEGRDDTILTLNNNLDQINFGGDSFHLISGDLKAEYAEYIDLFRNIRSLTETRKADLDLFTLPEFTATQRETLLRIRNLLLDERNTEHALIELRRIADYRNYRSYDFERRRGNETVELSRWGTGSAGETETPVYVIRVAVLASAFKIFSQQKKAHFRSIFMDEVFSTMDEPRTRRVLGFLKGLGLQVVCAAPTRSMAAVLDEFDTRINFSHYKTVTGDRSDVNLIKLDQARVRALYDTHRHTVAAAAAATFEKSEPPLRVFPAEHGRTAQSAGS